MKKAWVCVDLDLQGWGQQGLGCEATFHFSLANNYDDCSHLSPLSSRLWGHPCIHLAEEPNPKVRETRLPAVKSLCIPPPHLNFSEFPGFLPAAPKEEVSLPLFRLSLPPMLWSHPLGSPGSCSVNCISFFTILSLVSTGTFPFLLLLGRWLIFNEFLLCASSLLGDCVCCFIWFWQKPKGSVLVRTYSCQWKKHNSN